MKRVVGKVIGASIDAVSWDEAVGRLLDWGARRESRYVCICNVHSVVTARTDHEFAQVIESADMATPDGAPVAWLLRKQGFRGQDRINGPDLMWRYLAVAEKARQIVYFYGSTDDTLAKLRRAIEKEFPQLSIGGMVSPPFRQLSDTEQQQYIDTINASGAAVVFVGLGCPKQEKWMQAQRGRIQAVTVGVGAAFDYHAGTIQRAPLWMQRNGLEWLHRLCSEPKRLWKRYFVSNSLFIVYAAGQMLFGSGAR